MTPANDSVAFLGIGTMGHAMAASALRAEIQVVVWNRSPAAVEDLRDLGAVVAESPADAARRAAIVVTMLPDADVVLSVAQEQGMLAALAPRLHLGADEHHWCRWYRARGRTGRG